MRGAASVLADRAADRDLDRWGFAVIPLLDQADRAAVVDVFDRWGPATGIGFHADLNEEDPAYRRAVSAALSGALSTVVSAPFLRHVPFLWSFLVRWPGDDEELFIHRDWMFVPERTGARSYSLWIPTDDVVGDRGVLRVVPGSHLLRGPLAGSNLAPAWLAHREEIRLRLRSVEVRAGEAVVIDHALVHSSLPNRTAKSRVVLGVGLRDPRDQLVHYRRDDRGVVTVFEVDEEFFMTHTPGRLVAEPPERPVLGCELAADDEWTARELAAALDESGMRPASRSGGSRRRFRVRPKRGWRNRQ